MSRSEVQLEDAFEANAWVAFVVGTLKLFDNEFPTVEVFEQALGAADELLLEYRKRRPR